MRHISVHYRVCLCISVGAEASCLQVVTLGSAAIVLLRVFFNNLWQCLKSHTRSKGVSLSELPGALTEQLKCCFRTHSRGGRNCAMPVNSATW